MMMSIRKVYVGGCRTALFMGLSATLAFLPGCSKKVTVDSPVLAKVGDAVITAADFEKEVQWRLKTERPLPDKQALLEEMIERQLALQKAKAAELEKDAEVRRTYEDVLVARVKETGLNSKLESIKISAEEVSAAYDKEVSKYTRPAKAKLALIYLKTNSKLSAEKLAQLEERIHEAQNLAKALPSTDLGFGRVAIDFSDDQASRYKGGDVGWYDEGENEYRWPKEVVATGFALKQGEISEVIKAADGFYLVRKLDSREQVITPIEQVRSSLERRLLSQKRKETEEAFARELRAFAPVQKDPAALAKVQYPNTAIVKAQEPQPPVFSRPQ